MVNKLSGKKKRLVSKRTSFVPAPFWAVLRAFGKRRSNRWRLNPQMRKHWRKSKIRA